MALFQNTNPMQEVKNLARSILCKGPQISQEEYDSLTKELDQLRHALAEERCARADSEERCKALYNELQGEKKENREFRAKISILESSLAKAERLGASLETVVSMRETSIRRLSKLCFGKKTEALKRILGEKAFAELRGLLSPVNENNKAAEAAGSGRSEAPAGIDWTGLEEPDLGFLMDVMPWGEAAAAYFESDHIQGKRAALEAMTRKNIEDSTFSMEAMMRILYTKKNLANRDLDGLRDILAAMPPQSRGMYWKFPGENTVIKDMYVYKSYYPDRMLEIRGLGDGKSDADPSLSVKAGDIQSKVPCGPALGPHTSGSVGGSRQASAAGLSRGAADQGKSMPAGIIGGT